MPVTWYYAPIGAKSYYGLNAFESGIWDRDVPEQPHQLGEQPPYEYPYYNGKNVWGYLGQCMIGTPDQFGNGLTAADIAAGPIPFSQIPTCCKPNSLLGPVLGFKFDWIPCVVPCPCTPVAIGFRFDWFKAPGPIPGSRIPFLFAFDWLNPTPPGPGPRVPLGFDFDWLNPTPPGPGPRVPLGFDFDWLNPTPPGPGPRVPLGFDFDWLNPTPPGPGPRLLCGFLFDWLDPTSPGPGPRVEIPIRLDWLNPFGPGAGPRVFFGSAFDWFITVGPLTVTVPCSSVPVPVTLTAVVTDTVGTSGWAGSYAIVWDASTSQWYFASGTFPDGMRIEAKCAFGTHWAGGIGTLSSISLTFAVPTTNPPLYVDFGTFSGPSGTGSTVDLVVHA